MGSLALSASSLMLAGGKRAQGRGGTAAQARLPLRWPSTGAKARPGIPPAAPSAAMVLWHSPQRTAGSSRHAASRMPGWRCRLLWGWGQGWQLELTGQGVLQRLAASNRSPVPTKVHG